MKDWVFRRFQGIAAHFGCELVRSSRLNVVRDSINDLESFAGRSGFLRNKHGGGYHAERKVRRRCHALSRALTSVGA